MSMLTAHSPVVRLRHGTPAARFTTKSRSVPVGVYWLAAFAISITMWVGIVKGVFWLIA